MDALRRTDLSSLRHQLAALHSETGDLPLWDLDDGRQITLKWLLDEVGAACAVERQQDLSESQKEAICYAALLLGLGGDSEAAAEQPTEPASDDRLDPPGPPCRG